MKITNDQIRAMAAVIGLTIPEDEIPSVAIRLGALLGAMESIEAELGFRMDHVDPLPPVYPLAPQAKP